MTSLTGKVALVTGANSPGGLGFHVAYQLACKGAKVYIGARSSAKADKAIGEMVGLNRNIGREKLVPFVADIGDVRAVKAAAQHFAQSENRLDILIHNAALISSPLVINRDGISETFATNHFGPFVLTKELIPLLRETANITRDVRVIMTAAASYKVLPPGVRFDTPARFNAEMEPTILGGADFTRYSLTKLANILFAKELQKRFDASRISAMAMSLHPGLIKTDGVMKSITPEKQRSLEGRLMPVEGAATTLFAATSPDVFADKEKYAGAFLMPPGEIEEVLGDGKNEGLAKELWDTTERVLEKIWRS